MEKLLAIAAVARLPAISQGTLRRMIVRKHIPRVRVGTGHGTIRFTERQLEQCVERRTDWPPIRSRYRWLVPWKRLEGRHWNVLETTLS